MEFDPFGDPKSVGILGMAAGGLQASGMSRTPRSLGEIMGASLQSGILARGKAEEIATQKMLREAQAKKLQQELAEEQMFQTWLQQLPPQLRPLAMANRQAFGQHMMQQMFPKPKEDFTLRPGDTRFGPDGKPLASVPVEDTKGTWGQPFEMNGAMVQQNSATGEIRQAVGRPPQTRIDMPAPVTPVTVMENGKPVIKDARTGRMLGEAPPDKARQVSPAIAKAIADEIEEIGTAASISSNLGALQKQLETGALTVGPAENIIHQARNIAGVSTEQSRNYGSFKATLEKLRNDSLRLNKGVQTEGDAVRAWNENFPSLTDKKGLIQRLLEIQKINNDAVELRKAKIEALKGADSGMVVERAENRPPSLGQKNGVPLPPKGQPLVKGTVYQTSRGPAKWDGMRFVQEE